VQTKVEMFQIVTDNSLPGLTRASSRPSPVTRWVERVDGRITAVIFSLVNSGNKDKQFESWQALTFSYSPASPHLKRQLDRFSRFGTARACDQQTDKHTDRPCYNGNAAAYLS